MKTWLNRWCLTATMAALAGCNGRDVPNPPPVTTHAALEAFSGDNACGDLERYIEDTAVLQMRTQLEAERDNVPTWGWWGWWGVPSRFGGLDDAVPATAGASSNGAKSSAAPTSYTTTNNQVAGVDEADFVKNDGTRIFVLSGQRLNALRSWPAEQTSVQGTLTIEGWPREMFLDGQDKAVVFSSIYQWYPLSAAMGKLCASMDCGYSYANTVKATVIDVSDLTHLKVLREVYLPGYYNSARKVGSAVRLVLSDSFNYPPEMQWWPASVIWSDPNDGRRHAAFDELIATNEKLIRAQTLKEWVPDSKVVVNGVVTSVPHACGDFAKVNAPTRLGMVGVVTLNLDQSTIGRTTILAEPGQIYASAKDLYVATQHWWWWPAPGQKDTTYVHQFDISDPTAAHYVGSGTVDGHIKDQFSMDQSDDGHFRVVTTIGTRVPDANPNNWWGTIKWTNRVSVLAQNQGTLQVVGQTPDFAEGESLQASRIVGNKGFVVTYRSIDPLFTFDLSDPTNPKKVGEVTMPGFSTYLHPVDDGHLLGIGIYVPPTDGGVATNWQAQTLQLSIFDVTDLAHPKQAFTQQVGTAYSWSEALWDHKAFNYFPEKKLLAIPFSDWSYGSDGTFWWDRFVSDLRVFSVDAATGFTPRGAVSLSDMYAVEHWYNWTYYYTPQVRRSVMADDYVYAISDTGVRVANIANLAAPLASARFERYVPDPGGTGGSDGGTSTDAGTPDDAGTAIDGGSAPDAGKP